MGERTTLRLDMEQLSTHSEADAIARELRALSPDYAPTPLLSLPDLATRLGVASVMAKNEGKRTLGSFKSLGGTYAGLRALAKHAGTDITTIVGGSDLGRSLPPLITASAGNHGLAVAAAAQFAGSRARIFLYPGVSVSRRRRIAERGAEIVEIDGTYDDAVAAAQAAAIAGEGILVADTSADPSDPVVADVIAGYGVITMEIKRDVEATGHSRPSHLFVQAGVGGLAAALAAGLSDWMAEPRKIVVVEPVSAACVSAALESGSTIRVPGELLTSASMLACGEASGPALKTLGPMKVDTIALGEAALLSAPTTLRDGGGPFTSPSGAAGLAGLIAASADGMLAAGLSLDRDSRVLVVITEAELSD